MINEALPAYKLALWHGVTPALYLSAIAIIGGIALLLRHEAANNWRLRVRRPEAKTIFERVLLWRLLAFTRAFNRGLHNGSLQRMLAMIVMAVLAIVAVSLGAGGDLVGDRPQLAVSPLAVVGWALLVIACIGVTLLHRDRFLSLVLVGVIGLVVSVGFATLSAPDLALTQISVEVVTVVLMLLALNLLPKQTPHETPLLHRLRDIGIAGLSGLAAAVAAFAVMTRGYDSISAFHLDQSYKGGGGTNVVNVILVDFRGFDTFGEIIVLGIAALAIVAMIDNVSRGPSGQSLASWVPDQRR